ncbi:FAD-binding protein [Bacteroidota bacterium]
MKKDIINIKGTNFPTYSINTLIIGSGTASLNAALCLYNRGIKNIAIVTEKWGGGTSNNAGSDKQTYYKLSLSGKQKDSPFDMAKDLFDGGSMHGDIALCEAQHSLQAFYNLVRLGVPFPHDTYGAYVGYKTDHDPKGRGTSAGPLTSHLMFKCLAKEVEEKKIHVFKNYDIISLLTKNIDKINHVKGAISIDKNGKYGENLGLVIFNAVNIICGTGGPAGIYKDSVYPESQTGSTGLALKAGAVAQNLSESQFGIGSVKFRWNLSGSYQQVIPRYFSSDKDGNNEREFLNEFFPDMASLSGAIFLKGYQWPFDPKKVNNYGSSLIDLLVYRETQIMGRRVFLDYTKNPVATGKMKEFSFDFLENEAFEYLKRSEALLSTPIARLKSMNQPAVDLYKNNGIDISKEVLEIAVCAQHNNGGIKGNIWWESNVKHLFTVGELNGTHGVYRPGGSALNSGQVGGIRASKYISQHYDNEPVKSSSFVKECGSCISDLFNKTKRMMTDEDDNLNYSYKSEIQTRMSEYASLIRDPKNIKTVVKDAWDLYYSIKDNMRVKNVKDLPEAFKTLDFCLTHAIYLEAIAEYINKEGKSRGSYLVIDSNGEKINNKLEDEWRFLLNTKKSFVENNILEISLDEKSFIRKQWIKPKPIPQQEQWFETVWKNFREND